MNLYDDLLTMAVPAGEERCRGQGVQVFFIGSRCQRITREAIFVL
ncbi:MAG TPA: hypothetical protein PLZ36_06790 [Armatimonadota bacterium]|nr:hypothetical protein [Armatimonadota bacterium]